MITMITVITAMLSKDRTRKHIFPDKVHFLSFSLFTFHLTTSPILSPILEWDLQRRWSEGEAEEKRPSKSPCVGRLFRTQSDRHHPTPITQHLTPNTYHQFPFVAFDWKTWPAFFTLRSSLIRVQSYYLSRILTNCIAVFWLSQNEIKPTTR